MRKIFTLVLTLAALTSSAEQPVIIKDYIAPVRSNSVSRSGNVKLLLSLNTLPDGVFFGVMAARTVNGEVEVYYAREEPDGSVSIEMPEGTYDFLASGINDTAAKQFFLVEKNVEVDASQTSLAFFQSDATRLVIPKFVTPEGEEIDRSDFDSFFGSNSSVFFSYGGRHIFGDPYETGIANYNEFLTNATDNTFGLTTMNVTGLKGGCYFYVLPVDLTKDECSTTTEGWQSRRISVASNPMYEISLAYHEGQGEMYSMAYCGFAEDDNLICSLGQGLFSEELPDDVIYMWEPENYDGPYSMVSFPLGAVCFGNTSAVQGMPYLYGKDGLKRVASNWGMGAGLFSTPEERNVTLSNPYLEKLVPNAPLGNCAPVILTATEPDGATFQFECIGRNGEVMSIDSWNIYEAITQDADNEPWNGGTNTVSVYVDDQLLTENRSDFPNQIYWGEEGEYTIEIMTDNILIDGEIAGKSTCTTKYNPRESLCSIPSATWMGIVNADGRLTDRLVEPDGASLQLYAVTLAPDLESEIPSYIFSELSDVRVEYAPYGTGNFRELKVEAVPENDCIPGWGYFYKADLSGVEGESSNTWYDVRLTLETETGGSQQQVISPAFTVGPQNGIDGVSADNLAPVEYYNLQGQRIASPEKGQIVICRRGSQAAKVVF